MKKYITKKEKGFVQIPNSILSDPNISLKAKTVLAIMLSLPDNWDFSIDGISNKCKESKDCIAKAINELIDAGYVKRTRTHGEDGRITKWDYEVFEEPCKTSEQRKEELCEKNPEQVFPELDNPSLDNPSEDISDKENKDTYNTIINKKENNNILYNNTQSNPISSKNELRFDMSEIEKTRWIVKYNIDYDDLVKRDSMPKDMLDEIVELMVETICSKNETITIASNTYPHELVKSKFMKIDIDHIEYIIECVSNNKTKIKNIKQYLLAAIFNAPTTIGSYYTTKVNHDLYG
ncbi:MAG: helix-turn-helix domain-containing protein [Oscillospiraceae bacterium]|nr:helix-turn-helix domain-containing protein [Oscillospiraceae bacterium]